MSSVVGAVVSSKLATLHELQTIYGLEDALDLIEVSSVDAYNHRDNK
ncbi:hypothetical protein ACWIUH_05875 [Ursidibacter arcticus]